jgi:hypothetical protein
MCVLSHLKKTTCGLGNPGGGRNVWIAPVDAFVGDWGHIEDENGVVSVAPVMVTGYKWVELEVSEKSLKLLQNLKGSAGYQSWETTFELKVAGMSPEQRLAVEKLVNTEVVAVVRMNDLQKVIVGNTIFALEFEITHDSGAKGSDQRGYTLKAKNDGLSKSCPFLDESIILEVAA